MKKISRIMVKSASGYGPSTEAYEDRLTISEGGIQYLYKPFCPDVQRPRKWSYRTDRPEFRECWDELCNRIPDILALDEDFILDGSERTFIVAYDDKTKDVKTFWNFEEAFAPCFRAIRKMLPGGEKVPETLWLPEDEEDSE